MSAIVLPRLGWNMEQGVFLGWLKQEGAVVQVGDPLFTVEGDKAVQEIEAIEAGILRIAPSCPAVGTTVPVGTLLGHVETSTAPTTTNLAPPASPAVRHLARTLGVDLNAVAGHGPGGRITAADVQAANTATGTPPKSTPSSTPRARRAAQAHGVDWTTLQGTGRAGRICERDVLAQVPSNAVPSARRQTIAQRLHHSAHTTVPVTLTATADATNLLSLRQQFKTAQAQPVPSITDLFVKLTALALQRHPDMNARWRDTSVELLPAINIGIAVDTEAGLVVPIVADVPTLPLRDLAKRTAALIAQARQRALPATALQGGTFTITNLGAEGIDAFTPVINWPEAAILGIGAIRPQPTVVETQIVVRDLVTLSLTFDHRIVDGAPAARFLRTLRTGIENPAAWLVS